MSAPTTAPKMNTLALVGFIVAFVIPIAGLVLGIVAGRQLHQPGNVEVGAGFARWATIIGAVGVVVQLAFFLAWSSIFIGGLTHAAVS